MDENQKEIARIYFHIGNGGIGFAVHQSESGDTKTPVLEVGAHHLGQQTNGMKFSVRPKALQALGEMLIEASKLTVFEGESQVVVRNPPHVTYGEEVRPTGLQEEVACSQAPTTIFDPNWFEPPSAEKEL